MMTDHFSVEPLTRWMNGIHRLLPWEFHLWDNGIGVGDSFSLAYIVGIIRRYLWRFHSISTILLFSLLFVVLLCDWVIDFVGWSAYSLAWFECCRVLLFLIMLLLLILRCHKFLVFNGLFLSSNNMVYILVFFALHYYRVFLSTLFTLVKVKLLVRKCIQHLLVCHVLRCLGYYKGSFTNGRDKFRIFVLTCL